MSHISEVSTTLKDIAILQKALTTLGYSFKVAEQGTRLHVQAWDKEVIDAEMEIQLEGPYGIAVNQTEEGLELSADWWAIETYTEMTQEQIMGQFQKQYAYETVLDKVEAEGYTVVSEEEDSKENLHIVVRRWI